MNTAATGWKSALALTMLVASTFVQAGWELDNARSELNFISIKNAAVAETHRFRQLSGSIADDGAANVTIDLASVDTLIEIRDERMRELLFNTLKFPSAQLSASVEADLLDAVTDGEIVALDLPVTLSLHGVSKTVNVPVIAAGNDDELRVSSARPVVINAQDFSLADGITALQKIAGLQSIATAVPVTVNLVFTNAD
jgi:polyisoprenoid-binding protein YceI